MFYFSLLELQHLHTLHWFALGIQRLSDPFSSVSRYPGRLWKLFTNQYGGPPNWVALQEGNKVSEATTIELAN